MLVLALLLATVLAGSLVYFFVLKSAAKPKCDCEFPNSGTYGVIRDGKCVVTDCERSNK